MIPKRDLDRAREDKSLPNHNVDTPRWLVIVSIIFGALLAFMDVISISI